MTKEEELRQERAFIFLGRQAVEAHLSGDGLRTLHLCQIALDDLERKTSELGVQLRSVLWCFTFSLYWAIEAPILLTVNNCLNRFAKEADSDYCLRLLRYVLRILGNPFEQVAIDELLPVPEKAFGEPPFDRALVTLCSFAVELTWMQDVSGKPWQRLVAEWTLASPDGSRLKNALADLTERLMQQTALIWGGGPKVGAGSPLPSGATPLVEGYLLFASCDWKRLDEFVRRETGRTETDYIPLFRLLHVSRMHRYRAGATVEQPDDQLISLSRFEATTSRQAAEVYKILRERRLLEHMLELARIKRPVGRSSSWAAWARLAMLSQLGALRAWDFVDWTHAMGLLGAAYLDLVNFGHPEFATKAIMCCVKGLSVPAEKDDYRFHTAVESLDHATVEAREALVRGLLASRPIEWRDAYHAIDIMSDAIPESVVRDVATWCAALETTSVSLRGWQQTYLRPWKDILGVSRQTPQLIYELRSALLHACVTPLGWSDSGDVLISALVYGQIDLARELAARVTSYSIADELFAQMQWRIMYNACSRRPDLRTEFDAWLKEQAAGHIEREHYVRRMEGGALNGPVDDPEYRTYIIESIKRLAHEIVQSHGVNMPHFASSVPRVGTVTWEPEDFTFLDDLVHAIDADSGTPRQKLLALQIVADLLPFAHSAPGDRLTSEALRWVADPVPVFDWSVQFQVALSDWRVFGEGREILELGRWLVGEALLRIRADAARGVLTGRVFDDGLRQDAVSIDVVFAIMLRLALTAPVNDAPTATATVRLSEALASTAEDDVLVRVVQRFESVALGGGGGTALVLETVQTECSRILLDLWRRRLVRLRDARAPRVRLAVARCLRRWSTLASEDVDVTFPADLAAALLALKSDARASVRVSSGAEL